MKKYFSYIKIALVVLLLLFIVIDVKRDAESHSDINTVAAQVAKAADVGKESYAQERMIKRFYSLNPKEYEGAVLYAPKDNMDVNEIFIVKLKDKFRVKQLKKQFRKDWRHS